MPITTHVIEPIVRETPVSPVVEIDETNPLSPDQFNALIGLVVGRYEDLIDGYGRALSNPWVILNIPNSADHMFDLVRAGYATEYLDASGHLTVGISEGGEAWIMKHLGMPVDRDQRRAWVTNTLEPLFRRKGELRYLDHPRAPDKSLPEFVSSLGARKSRGPLNGVQASIWYALRANPGREFTVADLVLSTNAALRTVQQYVQALRNAGLVRVVKPSEPSKHYRGGSTKPTYATVGTLGRIPPCIRTEQPGFSAFDPNKVSMSPQRIRRKLPKKGT